MNLRLQKIFFFIFLWFIPVWLLGQDLVSEDTTSTQTPELHMIASFVKSFVQPANITTARAATVLKIFFITPPILPCA